MILSREGTQRHYFRVRASTIYAHSPFFNFADRESSMRARDTLLVSLPMFAKYVNLTSVKDIPYERLVIRMREGTTAEDQIKLVDDVKYALGS